MDRLKSGIGVCPRRTDREVTSMCGTYRAPDVLLSVEELKAILANASNHDYHVEEQSPEIETKHGLIRRTDSVFILTESGYRKMRWGIPLPGSSEPVLHARMETIDSKSLFQRAIPCIILAVSYGEKGYDFWPVYADESSTFFMAGVYRQRLGESIPGFAVVTRPSTYPQIHDRMPVILTTPDAKAWLENKYADKSVLERAVTDVHYELKKKGKNDPEQLSMF